MVMAQFDEFITSLRQEFGEQDAGLKFEVFCKWFLENDPEWSRTVDKVWLWDEYPNKWQRQDLGTDLVFRDNEGLIWAVQAKFYSEHRTTNKGDMNSFLADTGRKEVDRRLWLQTTNKMEAKADKTLKGQDKPVTVFMLNDFRDAQIDYPNSFADLYQAKVKAKPKPDPHQLEAIANVKRELQSLERGQMIMACGTGKTFTTLWIKEALEAQTTLVLLPSLSLLSQTMREWAWAGNTDFDILNVCSDKSVGKKTEDMAPEDAPFAVTSEVPEIAAFLKKSGPKVIFCTYQSSELIAEAQLDETLPAFDLAVADEAHRCAGKADAGFATILDGSKIRASKRLFTTATPRYFGQAIKDEANARDLAVVGMDNEEVFGPVVHRLTFGQAISDGLLNDYQVVIVGVDVPRVKEWIEDYEIVASDPNHPTDARTLAAKIGLIKAFKDYDLKRVISFHSRVQGAKEFSEELVDLVGLVEPVHRPEGTFLAGYVSGKMKASDRKDKIDRLKRLEGYGRGILTNARCLAEGVDVPSLDGVAFIDPRGSQVEIIQAVGRAIRKVRGAEVQKKGTIVLPVFIEDGDDPEASIDASNFKPVWDVLKALRAHDEILADTLDQYRTNMAKNVSQNRESISDKIIFDLPVTFGAEFSSALRTVLVEASTASWEFWFGLLEAFSEREGHCKVRTIHKENGFKLGVWVSTQRIKKEALSAERRQRLDVIGFVWDHHAETWEDGFSMLQKFKAREGHFRAPKGHKEEGFALGTWVQNQRNTKEALSAERRQRLDDLGFIWDPNTEAWEEGFRKLQQFKDREGHCRVPQGPKEEGYVLGTWVSTQRRAKEALPAGRRQRLDDLGFVWDSFTEAWEEGFRKLQQFKDREGHCKAPNSHKEDSFKLGTWVQNQRNTKEALSAERSQRLDDIGFVWDPLSEFWDEGFSKLQQFKEREGHCRVPQGYKEEGYVLGSWVGTQRRVKEALPAERRQRLDDLGFIWDPNTEAWEEGFRKLQQFKDREGHCRVPRNRKEDGYALGSWFGTQRRVKEALSAERRQRLDDLGFIWDPNNEAWEEGFRKLQQFKDREGHCRVPQGYKEEGYVLGTWVSTQRYIKEKMSAERRQRLDELGFIWESRIEAWEDAFIKLQQFKDREGHCRVPSSHKEGGYALGQWVGKQRNKKEVLSAERRQRLDDLGFVWAVSKD
jgi:superfamily II DNA or RNA helicase